MMKLALWRRVTSCILGLVVVYFSVTSVYWHIQNHTLSLANSIFLLGVLIVAIAMMCNKFWARKFFAIVLLLCAVSMPIVMINPFLAGDRMLEGQEPSSIHELVPNLIITELSLLILISLVDPRSEQ